MSEAANPICPITLFTPHPGDTHNQPHPMTQLPADLPQPFSLRKGPGEDAYFLTFHNQLPAEQGEAGNAARVYVAVFASDFRTPQYTVSVEVSPQSTSNIRIQPSWVGSAANLWFGSWWNNDTYPDSREGVIAFFTAHPEGGNHHTVPILLK